MTTVPAVMSSLSSIPSELLFLFEDPPLLRGEDRNAHRSLAAGVLAAIRPEDAVVLLFVKEFVEATWDIQRWRKMRTLLISMTQKDALRDILESLLGKDDIPEGSDRRATAEGMVEKWFYDPGSQMPVRRILGRLNLSDSAIEAQAAVLRLGDITMLEELIESAERRRKQALGMIEIYRASLATQLRAISLGEMIKGEKQNIPLVPNLK